MVTRISSFFRRINGRIARLNEWLSGAAMASGAVAGKSVNPSRVTTLLGEIDERNAQAETDDAESSADARGP
jgi:hypothetical protein